MKSKNDDEEECKEWDARALIPLEKERSRDGSKGEQSLDLKIMGGEMRGCVEGVRRGYNDAPKHVAGASRGRERTVLEEGSRGGDGDVQAQEGKCYEALNHIDLARCNRLWRNGNGAHFEEDYVEQCFWGLLYGYISIIAYQVKPQRSRPPLDQAEPTRYPPVLV
ncbi:hypothetical protein VNO78_23852 [Psophocarpus tetragonolobus]|uniref:Uncharacterized protein n=1 Tax=Psophocarpus tetragonolobus TaxID=3891 RepID=A0AAN9S5I9_PSOTE